MRKWAVLYENFKLPIRVTFCGFALTAIGSLILNDNVNIFYTFTNPWVINFARLVKLFGETIITALPLIILCNLTAKKANSDVPIVTGIIGYIVFLIVTMFFAPNLAHDAYTTSSVITYTQGGTAYYPLHTGFLGAIIVAFVTRFAYLRSRNRGLYSLLSFVNKDTAAIIYNIILCGIVGFGVALVYPFFFALVERVIAYVARDSQDPLRLAVYGGAERVMALFGLDDIIRRPFWYNSQGGSIMTIAGQVIAGDVNIWEYSQVSGLDVSTIINGCGRFITPYYVINMFVAPALYLGIYLSVSDKKERHGALLPFLMAIILSFAAGNPLPLEMILFFTSPLLWVAYLVIVMILFGLLPYLNAFLGFAYQGIISASLPGSFPDYIIQLRNPMLYDTIITIAIVGIIFFIITLFVTVVYYRYLANNLIGMSRNKLLINEILTAVGGIENIQIAQSGLFRLNLYLNDLESVSFKNLTALKVGRITERKDSISIALGASGVPIARAINKEISALQRS